MKLRNKKTGEVFNFTIKSNQENMESYLLLKTGSGGWEDGLGYATLAELNEEWEDYEPKQPLIKDEKVRKAVRAWAEVNGIDDVAYVARGNSFGRLGYSIMFDYDFVLNDGLEDARFYTIAELCGEEQE